MIRHHSANSAFDDFHDFHRDKGHVFLDWLEGAVRAAGGVAASQAAVRAIEAKLGRAIAVETQLAVGWLVNVAIDIATNVNASLSDGRTYNQIAYDNAIGVARARAIQKFGNLPPHAAAQLGAALAHIDDHHL